MLWVGPVILFALIGLFVLGSASKSGKRRPVGPLAVLLLPVAFIRAFLYQDAGYPFMPGSNNDPGPESQRPLPEEEQASEEDRTRYGGGRGKAA